MILKKPGVETGGDQSKNRDHQDNSIAKKNVILKRYGNLRRLAVNQTSVNNQLLKLMGKTCQE